VNESWPTAIRLAAVDFETPQILAAERTEPPGMAIVAGAFLGRRLTRFSLVALDRYIASNTVPAIGEHR
jgi:hypothetical protein